MHKEIEEVNRWIKGHQISCDTRIGGLERLNALREKRDGEQSTFNARIKDHIERDHDRVNMLWQAIDKMEKKEPSTQDTKRIEALEHYVKALEYKLEQAHEAMERHTVVPGSDRNILSRLEMLEARGLRGVREAVEVLFREYMNNEEIGREKRLAHAQAMLFSSQDIYQPKPQPKHQVCALTNKEVHVEVTNLRHICSPSQGFCKIEKVV